ncbi:zinc finger protein 830 [Hyalella azteca]|uniref:Zinc finger protein 830 n=1 Tax=Hyalella azteca TaxID=294128 RepID=A0A8B7P8T3_HYAAZ|nr:zinc finger protein 830 [Hyalella azteca]
MSVNKGKNSISTAQALMQEQLKSRSATRLVNSPHAKYNSRGQLMCVVCGCVVKSAILWQSHVIKKSHIDNLKNLQEKQQLLNSANKRKATNFPASAPAPKKLNVPTSLPPAPVKSILKKAGQSKSLEANEQQFVKKEEPSEPVPSLSTENAVKMELTEEELKQEEDNMEEDVAEDPQSYYLTAADRAPQQQPTSDLPEGFFDDPVADAKARKIEYVDKDEAEWTAFMREVSAAESTSRQIIADDTEEAAKRNQILQAEEQMLYYQRVIKFDREKQEKQTTTCKMEEASNIEEEESDDDDVTALAVDWRRKSCF